MSYVKKPKPYLNNRDLLAEFNKSIEQDKMTEKFAHMLLMIANRLLTKPNFANYSYKEDLAAYAMYMLVRQWRGFKPEITTNAFAFYTQCIKNAFYQYLNKETKQRNIRDALLIDIGLEPSSTYTNNYEDARNEDMPTQDDWYRWQDRKVTDVDIVKQ